MCVYVVMLKQMESDSKRFGGAAWSVAMPRLEKLKLLSAKETLQLMRARELCVTRRTQLIKQQVQLCVCLLSECVCLHMCVGGSVSVSPLPTLLCGCNN